MGKGIYVIKKNGSIEPFRKEAIVEAVKMAASRVYPKESASEDYIAFMSYEVADIVDKGFANRGPIQIKTEEIHNAVELVLAAKWEKVFISYSTFRNYRKEMAKSFEASREDSYKIRDYGDKENANKDSSLNSTKQSLVATRAMKEFMRYELDKEWIKAHEEGWIHIHDFGERWNLSHNCCLFNMAGLLDGGFTLNGQQYTEPKYFDSAINVMGDVTLFASAQQYGGFTIPEVDTVLSKYAEMTYNQHFEEISSFVGALMSEEEVKKEAVRKTIREIEQGLQGFETKLNTISNSLGQVPFVTISFGLDTSFWGRQIAISILNVRLKGMGKHKTTAVFPKLTFLHRNGINGKPGDPNYDIKLLGVECNKTRVYPDWLSLDSGTGHLGDVFDRSGKAVSFMGCRSALSPFYKEDGEEIYVGRSNVGVVTLNLPKYALESKGDTERMLELIDKYAQMAIDIHEDTYRKLSNVRGSSNPLYFVEGGSWMSIGMDEKAEEIYKASTASIGIIGLEEVVNMMKYKDRKQSKLNIVNYLKKIVDDAIINYSHLYSLYGSPAESIIYRLQNINRNDYGVVEGVTSRSYMTNSFHIPVWEDITVPDKIDEEADFHQIVTGGKISYTEMKYNTDSSVLLQAIDYAMSKGMYYGVNIISSTCEDCGNNGDFQGSCPKCNSHNVLVVARTCGYLGFAQINGETRYNPGKEQEVKDRVKHI